jgi:pseudouridine-5'-monophosphatase
VCSGSDSVGYKQKITQHTQLFSLFSHAVLAGDDPEVKHGKPAPDCYLVCVCVCVCVCMCLTTTKTHIILQICAQRFLTPPTSMEDCLVFEDAPNGVVSAIEANMQVLSILFIFIFIFRL